MAISDHWLWVHHSETGRKTPNHRHLWCAQSSWHAWRALCYCLLDIWFNNFSTQYLNVSIIKSIQSIKSDQMNLNKSHQTNPIKSVQRSLPSPSLASTSMVIRPSSRHSAHKKKMRCIPRHWISSSLWASRSAWHWEEVNSNMFTYPYLNA